ncbi:MAG: hypothetical protein VKN72_19920 [Nostocales cyanobacterium 94392]|nr:hypothetical protein [Nostocales cyanobacterium 94392]
MVEYTLLAKWLMEFCQEKVIHNHTQFGNNSLLIEENSGLSQPQVRSGDRKN